MTQLDISTLTQRRNELVYMLMMQTKQIDALKDQMEQAQANLGAINGAFQEVEHWINQISTGLQSNVNLGLVNTMPDLNSLKAA